MRINSWKPVMMKPVWKKTERHLDFFMQKEINYCQCFFEIFWEYPHLAIGSCISVI
jgi:hypothetical protein